MNNYNPLIDDLIRLSIAEDIGCGDKTTQFIVDPDTKAVGRVFAKEEQVTAGFVPFGRVFELLCSEIDCRFAVSEGCVVQAGELIAEMNGPFTALLTGERTALNFLQRLSGIATMTRQFVNKIKSSKAVLLDTRKTTPGWRVLEKEAVVRGGATNHRMGLFDGILIKENHIEACGGIKPAIEKVKAIKGPHLVIEVEVRSPAELEQALEAGPDIIMLDNMSIEEMDQAVRLTGGRAGLEASGNVTLDTIEAIASTGVDYISCGAITHSARAVDVSMIIERRN